MTQRWSILLSVNICTSKGMLVTSQNSEHERRGHHFHHEQTESVSIKGSAKHGEVIFVKLSLKGY